MKTKKLIKPVSEETLKSYCEEAFHYFIAKRGVNSWLWEYKAGFKDGWRDCFRQWERALNQLSKKNDNKRKSRRTSK